MDIYVDGGSGSYDIKEKLQTRKGPWCEEEDYKLVDYINNHGEGRWDSLARTAGYSYICMYVCMYVCKIFATLVAIVNNFIVISY